MISSAAEQRPSLDELSSFRLPSRDAFAPILRPDTNVVRVGRPFDPVLREHLDDLAQASTFDHSAPLDTSAPDATALLVSVPDGPAKDFLAADIAHLAVWFGAVLERRHLHARFFIMRSDGCRKIHTDRVTLRLLCTYAGPGTEWLANRDFVRKHLARVDVDLDTANRSMIREGGSLQRCATGDVLVLKGDAYPGNEGLGVGHRSPPLGSSGVARLILKIDEQPCGC